MRSKFRLPVKTPRVYRSALHKRNEEGMQYKTKKRAFEQQRMLRSEVQIPSISLLTRNCCEGKNYLFEVISLKECRKSQEKCIDRVEAGYDIISEPTRVANTRFVDALYITA